jgi:SCY1-like protein 2
MISDILPLIQLGMDSPTHSLVDAAMKCLPVILPVLDFSTVKNEVFPPIASTFSKTSSLAIKVRGLEAFVVLCGGSAGKEADSVDDLSGVIDDIKATRTSTASILDKYTIQEKLVPLLKAVKTKEPGVMMATLNVFKQVGKLVDTDFLALEVLPILWSCSLGPLLNLQQFNEFMALIKSLSTKIEREHSKKLQELSSRDEGAASRNGLRGTVSGNFGASDPEATTSDFERLVLGRNGTTNTNGDNVWDNWSSEPAAVNPASSVTSPTFSWSSTPSQSINRSSVTTRPNAFSSAGQTSRSITPDSSISAFPSLEPTRQSSNMATSSQAWRQSTPSWSQMNPVSPPPPTPNSGSISSFATLEGMRTSTFGQTSTQTPSYPPFSIPPPANNSQRTPHLSSSALPTAGKAWAAHSTAGFPSQSTTSVPKEEQQKQGLDKYASLL